LKPTEQIYNTQKPKLKRQQEGTTWRPSNFSKKITSTEWIQVTQIPPLSTLDDLLPDIQRIITTELSMGIVDLDATEEMLKHEDVKNSPQLPLWKPDSSLSPHMVVEARLMLSTLKRQQGWYLKLANRSVVHALLSHLNEARKIEADYTRQKWAIIKNNKKKSKSMVGHLNHIDDAVELENIPALCWKDMQIRPLMCAWRRVDVSPFYVQDSCSAFMDGIKYMLGENVLRVENCSRESTIDDVKYFFRKYAFYDERLDTDRKLKAVEKVVHGRREVPSNSKDTTPCMTSSYLVRFASAADARAAMREKQNVELLGRRVRLAQYSRQIIPS
jgi:hypothetical protein